jgi:GH25 family lysozyme M1 (1,4-beta-N-acetylmuramidase)
MTQKTSVIDLSSWSVIHDMAQLVASGVAGVVHKVSEGTTFADPMYGARRITAAQSKLLWGGYHFLRPGSILQQAQFFAGTAVAPEPTTLLAVHHDDRGVSLADLLQFLDAAETLTHRSLVLCSGNIIKEQVAAGVTTEQATALAKRRLWITDYSADTPVWPKAIWPQWWLWQHAGCDPQSPGSIGGMTGAVNCSTFGGSVEDLTTQWAGMT